MASPTGGIATVPAPEPEADDQQPQPGTAVAPRTEPRQLVNVPLGRALENMDQAYRLAQAFAMADIVPQDLRGKPANVFLVMLYGQRLGLPPEISINSISVVKGRPRMAGQLLLAKVREAGHKPKIEHGDNECTVTITRGDDDTTHTETFTLNDAVQARLCKIVDGKVQARSQKGEPLPWEAYTKRMLMWRALGFCVDVICPEVKMGFVVEGELDGGLEPQGVTVAPAAGPALAAVAAKRADAERTDQPENAPAEDTGQQQPDEQQDSAQVEQDDEAPPPDDDAMAAEMAAIEAEHRAEYGDGPSQQGLDFGSGDGSR